MQNRTDTPADQRTAATARPESPNVSQGAATTATVPSAATQSSTSGETRGDEAQLLPVDVLQEFRVSWERIQTGFVDQPRESVQSAHDLVGQLVERLSQSFARQRDGLEGTWSRGADVSTEDLRVALQRYRSFFDRLLST
jgi:hypothetical protein